MSQYIKLDGYRGILIEAACFPPIHYADHPRQPGESLPRAGSNYEYFNRYSFLYVFVADEQFDELCFEFGIELDEVVLNIF